MLSSIEEGLTRGTLLDSAGSLSVKSEAFVEVTNEDESDDSRGFYSYCLTSVDGLKDSI